MVRSSVLVSSSPQDGWLGDTPALNSTAVFSVCSPVFLEKITQLACCKIHNRAQWYRMLCSVSQGCLFSFFFSARIFLKISIHTFYTFSFFWSREKKFIFPSPRLQTSHIETRDFSPPAFCEEKRDSGPVKSQLSYSLGSGSHCF